MMILKDGAICKSRNGESGNEMRGMTEMWGITVRMRGIRIGMIEMWRIRVGIKGIRVGMIKMWGNKLGIFI